jgi:hypothetical protein
VLDYFQLHYLIRGSKHNVDVLLKNYGHCLIGELESGGITPWKDKLSSRWVEIDSFIFQPLFPL